VSYVNNLLCVTIQFLTGRFYPGLARRSSAREPGVEGCFPGLL